jgi:hypothetical protein
MSNRGGNRKGSGRKPLPPERRLEGHQVRLSAEQTVQLQRIGNGNLSEGIRRLLSRYDHLISLWRHNATFARNALDTARHFGADTRVFEDKVREAESQLSQFETEYDIVSTLSPSTE